MFTLLMELVHTYLSGFRYQLWDLHRVEKGYKEEINGRKNRSRLLIDTGDFSALPTNPRSRHRQLTSQRSRWGFFLSEAFVRKEEESIFFREKQRVGVESCGSTTLSCGFISVLVGTGVLQLHPHYIQLTPFCRETDTSKSKLKITEHRWAKRRVGEWRVLHANQT
ncbi:hypothetical protein GOODEAATRI_006457 [Goodea atripinnis]|uniref:Uncharacterized protein n=1 Tax=Goodea atripinnis TaxID=208336 RepID=A0ABV0PLE1_9TELE